jgi:hypothetical protein
MKNRSVFFLILALTSFSTNCVNGQSLGEEGVLIEQWSYSLQPRYVWGWFGSSPAIADLGAEVNEKGVEPTEDLEIITGSDEYCNYYPELGRWACGISGWYNKIEIRKGFLLPVYLFGR